MRVAQSELQRNERASGGTGKARDVGKRAWLPWTRILPTLPSLPRDLVLAQCFQCLNGSVVREAARAAALHHEVLDGLCTPDGFRSKACSDPCADPNVALAARHSSFLA